MSLNCSVGGKWSRIYSRIAGRSNHLVLVSKFTESINNEVRDEIFLMQKQKFFGKVKPIMTRLFKCVQKYNCPMILLFSLPTDLSLCAISYLSLHYWHPRISYIIQEIIDSEDWFSFLLLSSSLYKLHIWHWLDL